MAARSEAPRRDRAFAAAAKVSTELRELVRIELLLEMTLHENQALLASERRLRRGEFLAERLAGPEEQGVERGACEREPRLDLRSRPSLQVMEDDRQTVAGKKPRERVLQDVVAGLLDRLCHERGFVERRLARMRPKGDDALSADIPRDREDPGALVQGVDAVEQRPVSVHERGLADVLRVRTAVGAPARQCEDLAGVLPVERLDRLLAGSPAHSC